MASAISAAETKQLARLLHNSLTGGGDGFFSTVMQKMKPQVNTDKNRN